MWCMCTVAAAAAAAAAAVNTLSPPPPALSRCNQTVATAFLGTGCFWCTEACYKDLKGVSHVVSGYAGGHVSNPSYEAVSLRRRGSGRGDGNWGGRGGREDCSSLHPKRSRAPFSVCTSTNLHEHP